MVSDMNIFVWKLSKITAQKKVFFSSLFSLLRYRLTVFFPPLPEVQCPIVLEIRNPWGKVMERSGLTLQQFWFGSGLKSPRKKKFFFFWFCLGPPSYGIGASIRIGREMLCLPYVGFKKKYFSSWQRVAEVDVFLAEKEEGLNGTIVLFVTADDPR